MALPGLRCRNDSRRVWPHATTMYLPISGRAASMTLSAATTDCVPRRNPARSGGQSDPWAPRNPCRPVCDSLSAAPNGRILIGPTPTPRRPMRTVATPTRTMPLRLTNRPRQCCIASRTPTAATPLNRSRRLRIPECAGRTYADCFRQLKNTTGMGAFDYAVLFAPIRFRRPGHAGPHDNHPARSSPLEGSLRP